MRYVRRFVVGAMLLLPMIAVADDAQPDLQLTLPPQVDVVPGVEFSIYFDNIVLTQTPVKFKFDVQCDVGRTEQRRWVVTPQPEDVGQHAFQITVCDASGEILGRAKTTLNVIPQNAGEGKAIKILIIGDSLTHATLYPNELARLLSQPHNPTWQLLGTHKPKSAAPGVAHEGYGGWTWSRFATKYEPDPDGTYRKRSSPFVYLDDMDKPTLDFVRYFKEECADERPDLVIIMLGINDCFGANPEERSAMDDRIDSMFEHASKLLTNLQHAAPNARFGICLTTPPNSRQEAFEANYGDRYSRWGWKRIQHRLVQRQIEHFGDSDNKMLEIIPTELNLDPIDGYPENNGVHPNATGYKQIAASIYGWVKATTSSSFED